MKEYKLPRQLVSDPKTAGLLDHIFSRVRKLKAESEFSVPLFELTDRFKKSLLASRRAGHVVRGFENAFDLLALERDGINKIINQSGQGDRVSRLVLVSNDGADDFYNKAEKLILRHSPRVLGCIVQTDSYNLGSLLFGDGKIAKLILIDHKDDVSQILMTTICKNEK